MKIVIDTKEDLHNLRHIIQLLHAISVNGGGSKKYLYENSSQLFSDAPSSITPSPAPEAPGLFNMFDSSTGGTSSLSSSSVPSSPIDIPSIFQEKKDDNTRDFLDSLQVY